MDWLQKIFSTDFISSAVDGIFLPLLLILIFFVLGARYVYKKHINRLKNIDRRSFK